MNKVKLTQGITCGPLCFRGTYFDIKDYFRRSEKKIGNERKVFQPSSTYYPQNVFALSK